MGAGISARKDEAGQQDGRQHDDEGELHGLQLRFGQRGDEQSQAERANHEQHGQRQQQHNIAADWHTEHVDHDADDDEQFDEADDRVRDEFSQQQASAPDRRDKQLFQCAEFPLPHDGEGSEKQRHELQDDADQPRYEEEGAFQIGVVEQSRTHIDGHTEIPTGVSSGSEVGRFSLRCAREMDMFTPSS